MSFMMGRISLFLKSSHPRTNAGAGCTFASSIASQLVKGEELLPAIETSKAFVYRAIAQADQYGVRQYEANQNN